MPPHKARAVSPRRPQPHTNGKSSPPPQAVQPRPERQSQLGLERQRRAGGWPRGAGTHCSGGAAGHCPSIPSRRGTPTAGPPPSPRRGPLGPRHCSGTAPVIGQPQPGLDRSTAPGSNESPRASRPLPPVEDTSPQPPPQLSETQARGGGGEQEEPNARGEGTGLASAAKIKGLYTTCTRGWQTRHWCGTLSAPSGAARRAQQQRRCHRGRVDGWPTQGVCRASLPTSPPAHGITANATTGHRAMTCLGNSSDDLCI